MLEEVGNAKILERLLFPISNSAFQLANLSVETACSSVLKHVMTAIKMKSDAKIPVLEHEKAGDVTEDLPLLKTEAMGSQVFALQFAVMVLL